MYNAMEINGVKILRQRGNEVGEQGGESLDAGRI